MLAVVVGTARKMFPESRERVTFFRKLGRRFLMIGGSALLVAIATGSDMAADRLGSWGDLFNTDYGRRLTEKLCLVVLVIVLTLLHSLVQGPALSRLREQSFDRPHDAQLAAAIRRKSMQAGIVNTVILLATLAILVMAARLVRP